MERPRGLGQIGIAECTEVLMNLSWHDRTSQIAESALETGELGFGPAESQPLLRRQIAGAVALAAAIAFFSGLAVIREPLSTQPPAQNVAAARGLVQVAPLFDDRPR
jgi:hypothetical protein